MSADPSRMSYLIAHFFRMGQSCRMADRNRWDVEIRRLVESPFRLRFELGGECLSNVTQPVPRFIQAFDRARHVAEAVFLDSAIVAVVGSSSSTTKSDDFRTLRDLGFAAPMIGEWAAPRYRGDGSCLWKCFDIGADRPARDTLLWCSVSAEMSVGPKASITTYLLEPTRRIVLHVYDDRGMDVSANRADALTATFVACDRWLLDYDRPRMAEAFELGRA